MRDRLFEEKQVFKGTDLLIVSTLSMALISLAFWQNLSSSNWVELPMQSIAVFILLLIVVGIWFSSLLRMKQRNVITRKHLICKIKRWQKHKRKVSLNNISQVSIIESSLAAQWGGRNLTYSDEEFWSINGRNGLSISTKDGQQIFIGSQRPHQMAQALKNALQGK